MSCDSAQKAQQFVGVARSANGVVSVKSFLQTIERPSLVVPMELGDAGTWSTNWAWGLPLIVLTTVIHVLGLGFINERVVSALQRHMDHRRFTSLFAVAMSVVVLLVTVLHAFEAALWAVAYLLLGARPDPKSAMLYSLSALTSYGHANVFLASHWQMMGALESLNGMLLFGLDHGLSLLHDPARLASRQQGPALALVTSMTPPSPRLARRSRPRRPTPRQGGLTPRRHRSAGCSKRAAAEVTRCRGIQY